MFKNSAKIIAVFISFTSLIIRSQDDTVYNLVENLEVTKYQITVTPSAVLKPYYLKSDFFVIYEDDIGLEEMDFSIVSIPFVMAVIPIVWVSGKKFAYRFYG